VPGGVSLLAVLVSIRSSVVKNAASIAIATTIAKSTMGVRWPFRSLLMRDLHSNGRNVIRLGWFPMRTGWIEEVKERLS
jgi:ABC-type proline/glycine betaine transport system permease subunit